MRLFWSGICDPYICPVEPMQFVRKGVLPSNSISNVRFCYSFISSIAVLLALSFFCWKVWWWFWLATDLTHTTHGTTHTHTYTHTYTHTQTYSNSHAQHNNTQNTRFLLCELKRLSKVIWLILDWFMIMFKFTLNLRFEIFSIPKRDIEVRPTLHQCTLVQVFCLSFKHNCISTRIYFWHNTQI